jgi:hypothetical protein
VVLVGSRRAEVVGVCGEALGVDPSALDDESLGAHIAALESLIRRAVAAQAAAVRVFEVRDAANGFGSPSAKAWLCAHVGASERDARTLVGLGRSLDRFPALAAAFASGTVTAGHLRVAATATRALDAETVATGDAFLTPLARMLDAGRFAVIVRRWVATVAAEAFERDTERRYDARWFSVRETFAGMYSVAGMLDPENGALLTAALDGLTAGIPHEDPRTTDQRRADALIDLVQVALAHGDTPASGAARPEIIVHVSAETLAGDPGSPPTTLDGGEPLTPAALDRLGCDAHWRRLLLDPAGIPVELGRATRTIPPALRKYVALRDGGCRYPGCTRRPAHCEAHHAVYWRDGGTTDATNLVLLCRYHHHVVHDRHHQLKLLPDGTVEVTRPDGHILSSRPRGPTCALAA